MDTAQFAYWLIVTTLLVLPLATWDYVSRHVPAEQLSRFRSWAADRTTAVPEPDEFTAELAQVIRRDRLVADIARLRRILATDEFKSAVRQIGNRMAYEQLLYELRTMPEQLTPVAAPAAGSTWTVPQALAPDDAVTGYGYRPARQVETLDIGWRG